MTDRETLTLIRNQHEAIDRLMALVLTREGELERNRLIERPNMFMPTQSGFVWETCLAGNAAITALEHKLAAAATT